MLVVFLICLSGCVGFLERGEDGDMSDETLFLV